MTALIGTVILVLIGLASLRAVRRRISYERWHFLHLLTYLAVGLGFAHQLAGPTLLAGSGCRLPGLCCTPTPSRWCCDGEVLQPFFQLWRHRLRVEDVRQESADVMSVLMSGQHLDELRAEPGQFFRWRFLTRETWRSAYPFSLSGTTRPATGYGSPSRPTATGHGGSSRYPAARWSSRKARTVSSPAVAFGGRGSC